MPSYPTMANFHKDEKRVIFIENEYNTSKPFFTFTNDRNHCESFELFGGLLKIYKYFSCEYGNTVVITSISGDTLKDLGNEGTQDKILSLIAPGPHMIILPLCPPTIQSVLEDIESILNSLVINLGDSISRYFVLGLVGFSKRSLEKLNYECSSFPRLRYLVTARRTISINEESQLPNALLEFLNTDVLIGGLKFFSNKELVTANKIINQEITRQSRIHLDEYKALEVKMTYLMEEVRRTSNLKLQLTKRSSNLRDTVRFTIGQRGFRDFSEHMPE